MKYFPLALSFLFFTFAYSAKGPEYRSLKVHGMGGAFVAVADGKDALYYNPAGLNLIDRLGNFEKNPEMGYMPWSKSEVRLFSAAVFLPANEIDNVIDACGAPSLGKVIKKVLFFDFGFFGDAAWCPKYMDVIPDDNEFLPDSLRAHPELAENLRRIDHSNIEMGTQVSLLEIATHNFGFAGWLRASAAPYVDVGIFVPTFGYDPIQIDGVAQTAFAFSPVDNWSVGAGLKVAKRYNQARYDFKPSMDFNTNIGEPTINKEELVDSINYRWKNVKDDLWDADWAIGMDLGVLYQITREVRLGSSLRNVFFSKLAGESITPNWSIGAMTSPMILQSNSFWARRVNFAIDYVDILDGTITEKFFSHLNFGAEIDQVVIPSPTREMSFLYRALFGIVGGAVGLGIGNVIGDGYGGYGVLIGMGVGTIAGIKFGIGGDALRVSLGGGFEGGYPAFNLGFGLFGDVINMRFGSYAEERGVKTGQNGHRFWTGEFSIGF
ncbi:MAG: hypothetical protein LBC75_05030 [Fibromonadaceae bacterium]|nr:hypothetical protein [Fibromonadaceae bacterium]